MNALLPAASRSMKCERQRDERQQQVVQFVLVAEIGPELRAHGVDRGLIETASAVGNRIGQRAAKGDSAGAAACSVLVVKKAVGHGVDQLVRELRGHRRIDSYAVTAPDAMPRSTSFRPSMSMASESVSRITSRTSG